MPYEAKGGAEGVVHTVAKALRLYITDGEFALLRHSPDVLLRFPEKAGSAVYRICGLLG
jgi:hypothetical protein